MPKDDLNLSAKNTVIEVYQQRGTKLAVKYVHNYTDADSKVPYQIEGTTEVTLGAVPAWNIAKEAIILAVKSHIKANMFVGRKFEADIDVNKKAPDLKGAKGGSDAKKSI